MAPRSSLPPLPKTQALTSSTFKIPPLDGSLSVPELYDWHYHHKTDHPVFVFPGEKDEQTTIKWPELVRAIHTGARIIRGLAKPTGNPSESVVAIFTTSETFTYFTLIAATFRAGFVPFLISHRNSAEALAFLLSETRVDYVLVDRGTDMQEVLRGALQLMQQTYPRVNIPPYSEVPLFEELFTNDVSFQLLPPYRPNMDSLAMILHSSGSTAYPKAIRWTHMQTLQLGFVPYFGERDLTGFRLSCHAMPMSHGTGMMQTVWTASMGIVITAAVPKSPGIPPTPDNVIASAKATSTDIIFCVPMYIEAWSHDPRTVDFLSNINGLLFCGALLNKEIGDRMTQKGVSIFNLYGCAEAGIISPIIPRNSGLDWEYFTVSNQMEWKLVPNGLGQNRLAIMPTPYYTPLVVNGKVDGKGASFTDDLFVAHPTRRGYFKLFGRVDDQIEHVTGETTNPVPLENLLNQDPRIRASVIFGRGQFNLGVTIDPIQSFDPHDAKQLAEFRNAIWPTIEQVNKIAPRHSHLLKEMILVALPSKPLEYTAKNTARRQRIIAHYKAEIDALYQKTNRTSLTNLDLPRKWDVTSARNFVGEVVKTTLGVGTLGDDDLFLHDCDSHQGTLITNTILRALSDTTRINTNNIADVLLDHHPSINKLATFCVKFAAKGSYSAESVGDYQIIIDNMKEMVERFGSNFSERSGSFTHCVKESDHDGSDVFLVAGTTDFLGASLLGNLLKSRNTRTVYAVNRGKHDGASLASRQEAAFRNLGLPADLITQDKLVLVEADVSDEHAGLTSGLIEEIRSSVTHIILNAWPMDPDIPLQSFEPTIKSIRSLIDIALSSYRPKLPTVVFVSSMGVLSNGQQGTMALEIPANADEAVTTGQTQAKWVAESICLNASQSTSLQTRIVRLGRICGSTNGYGRNPGWIQGIVKSSMIVGCLPDIGDDKELSWVPVDDASRVVLELLRSDQGGIFHLVHPKPVAASLVFGWISSALNIPVVPSQEWLSRLTSIHADSDVSSNLGLLNEVQLGPQRVDISQCCRSSATMGRASIRQINEEEVIRLLQRWTK